MARRVSIELVADYSSVQRGFSQAGRSAKNFEKDFSHTTRGIIAGSGAIRGLGRSLAFASGGFLAFAGVAGALRDSIIGAENLQKAQESLTVSIEHTHGSVKKLLPQYEATAKAAQQFGINEADALTALNRATVLTGNAAKAQRAYEEALVISKATGKDFNQVLTATAKGQEGITTSLQRYGIKIAKGTDGQKQFTMVMARFAGQARTNTSTIDRFNATLQNTEEVIGTALLPILNKYLGELGKWLDKMTKTGRLQSDVKRGAHDISSALTIAANAVKKVDDATGSFVNTLKILLGLKLVAYLRGIAKEYIAVAGAEARAAAAGGAASVGAGAAGAAAGAAGAAGPSLAERIAPYTITGGAAAATAARNAAFRSGLARLGGISGAIVGGFALGNAGAEMGQDRIGPDGYRYIRVGNGPWIRAEFVGIPGAGAITLPGFRRPGSGFNLFGAFPSFADPRRSRAASGPFAAARPLPAPFKTFTVPIADQIAQAQAGLTKTTADDVAAAKKVIAYIKKLVAAGRLSGPALVTALGEEATAMGVIQSAQQQAAAAAKAAAQKAKEAAAKAKAKQQAFLDNLIDPIKLEVELSKAQAQGKSTTRILRELRASALKALHTGKLSLQQQKAAWDQVASLNQQIKDALNQGTKSALGNFKQLNTRAIAKRLGLTGQQAAELRAALSQVGPGGTVPNKGVGAFGYQIGDNGRPIVIHHTTKLDGKVVERSVTRHQQRRRRRESTQRRGPNAGG